MNSQYFADSFDIVKRFFCGHVRELGYEVFIDPLFADTWGEKESAFYRLLGVRNVRECCSDKCPSALFLDPDTGVAEKGGSKHVSFDRMASELETHALVFAFDQSFSRHGDPAAIMQKKLAALSDRGCYALYYDSHARFLFAARQLARLLCLRQYLHELGIPDFRLVLKAEVRA